ncbi:MAG TPA: biotin--[acetyl-CoA-carboxylase] ligase [Thermoanaerobaculia bacterium]|nr:biotin--[acetyl-CoA-carboxylase] ligase [Thermoanaerobaculia bacterium]
MIDTRAVVSRLHTIESLAVIPRVASTNLVARRVVTECIENELSLPQAMIVAGEQFAGRGRNQRSWSSPRGKGIYATILLTRTAEQMGLIPLSMATVVARYLIEVFQIAARIKWPNDILLAGRKIAGILIEGRVQEGRAYLAIGIGVNLEPVPDEQRPNAISVRELAPRDYHGVDPATIAFIEHVDAGLSRRESRQEILAAWRALSMYEPGEPITCVVGQRTFTGTWAGIDEMGRARLLTPSGEETIASGDLIVT